MRLAALAVVLLAAALPATAHAGSCPAIHSEFAAVSQLRTFGGAGCGYAHYFGRVWIKKSERGRLGPVTRNMYRCAGKTIAAQTLRVTCVHGTRRVVFRLFIRNG